MAAFITALISRSIREKSKPEISLALAEAWAWLESTRSCWFRLVIRTATQRLARHQPPRAKDPETEAEFASTKSRAFFRRNCYTPKSRDVVWGAFMRGEFDGAAFHAMKGVEVISVRRQQDRG